MKQIIVPIAFMTMVALITVGRPIARAWARRLERGVDRTPTLDGEARARLERMEQAIEAMALEVERIAEGQRFTSKLLAARADVARPEGALAEPSTEGRTRVG